MSPDDEVLYISLEQLAEQVLRVDAEIKKRVNSNYSQSPMMSAIVQTWKYQVNAIERMVYATEKLQEEEQS